MIQVYRIESKPEDDPEIIFSEVCHSCAEFKKNEGFQITYDLYFSEKYPDDIKDECCQICEGSFWVDGRKINKGCLKSDFFSIC